MRKWLALGSLLLLLVGLIPYRTLAQEPAATPRLVTGKVTDLTGRPVTGALVQVLDHTGRVVSSTTTAAGGTFRTVAGLESGAIFRLQVWATGYRRGSTPWQGAWDTRPLHVSLTPFGGELRGVVRDEGGVPAPGATVELRSETGQVVAVTTAGAGGAYTLSAPAGRWVLTGALEGRPLVPRQVTLADGSLQTADLTSAAVAVTVEGQLRAAGTGQPIGNTVVEAYRTGYGRIAVAPVTAPDGRFSIALPVTESPELTLRAWPEGYQLVESEPFALAADQPADFAGARALVAEPLTAAVHGILSTANGKVLRRMPVWVERDGLGIVAETTSDDEGRFTFASLPAGAANDAIRYRVRSAPAYYLTSTTPWFTLTPGETRPLALVAQVPVTVNTAPERVLVMGRVTDPEGRPVSGAEVTISREAALFTETRQTDERGLFRFQVWGTRDGQGAGPGYRIRVARTGYFSTEDLNGAGGEQDVLQFSPGEPQVLDLNLVPSHGIVAGRVVDAEGHPLAGATVRLLRDGFREVAATRTDAAGRYRFSGVAVAGYPAYRVQAEAEGYRPAATAAGTDATPGTALADLTLVPVWAAARGRVTDRAGVPLPGVEVTATWPGAAEAVRTATAADGNWELPELPSGTPVTFHFSRQGLYPVTLAAGDLAPGAETSLQLSLFPTSACLTGRVTGSLGEQIPGVTVQLFREGAGAVGTATAGPDGSFRFDNLPTGAGWYWLNAQVPGYRPGLPETALFPLLPPVTGACVQQNLVLVPVTD